MGLIGKEFCLDFLGQAAEGLTNVEFRELGIRKSYISRARVMCRSIENVIRYVPEVSLELKKRGKTLDAFIKIQEAVPGSARLRHPVQN